MKLKIKPPKHKNFVKRSLFLNPLKPVKVQDHVKWKMFAYGGKVRSIETTCLGYLYRILDHDQYVLLKILDHDMYKKKVQGSLKCNKRFVAPNAVFQAMNKAYEDMQGNVEVEKRSS